MWLVKRKQKARVDGPEQRSIGTRIGRGILKLQMGFAQRLNVAAAKVPVTKLKQALVIFCLISGGLSGYVAMNGVLGNNERNRMTIDQASVPKHVDRSGDEVREVQNMLDGELAGQIQTFKAYMDSLLKNNKATYDSLLLARPGLMDSIKQLEEIYLSR